MNSADTEECCVCVCVCVCTCVRVCHDKLLYMNANVFYRINSLLCYQACKKMGDLSEGVSGLTLLHGTH